MSVKDLQGKQHGTVRRSGGEDTCQSYVAEDWIMSDDIGYSGDDWGGYEEATTTTGSTWMSIAGLALSLMALGTAVYATFVSRNLVRDAQQKVQSATVRAANEARELAEATRQAVSSSGNVTSATGSAPGL